MEPNGPTLPTLHARRLHLRPLALADSEALHRAYGDPEAMRFWDFPASSDVQETAKRIERSLSVPPQWHAAWMVVLNNGGSPIGLVNYHSRQPWNRRLEIGYILERRYWRQGLMREAIGAFLGYCFDSLETHRVEATIEPENTASRRFAEGMGFICESGVMRDRLLVQDRFRSLLMYALLAPEWRARTAL